MNTVNALKVWMSEYHTDVSSYEPRYSTTITMKAYVDRNESLASLRDVREGFKLGGPLYLVDESVAEITRKLKNAEEMIEILTYERDEAIKRVAVLKKLSKGLIDGI